MNRFSHVFFRVTKRCMLPLSLFVSTIAATGFAANSFGISSKVYAQNPPVNPNEATNYASAVLKMEPARQQAFDEIKRIMGNGELPKIICNDTNSLSGLPGKARDVAVNYCNSSQTIVEQNGLSINRFNEITVQVQNDQNLQKQISRELLRLQSNPETR